MQLFVVTNHCTSRVHCNTCRSLESGRPWREGLKKHFSLPKDEVDFACPYGLPWKNGASTQNNTIVGAAAPKIEKVSNSTETPEKKAGCIPCQRKRST